MYQHSTRGRLTPRNSVLIFHSLSSDFFVSALVRRCTSLLVSSIVEPMCSAPRAACVSLSFRVCYEYLCVLGRLAPRARCVCVPCRTCRAFSLFSFYFDPACTARPCVSLPIEPVCSPASRSFAFPWLTSARAHSYAQYSTFRLCCRCHVTRTRWS